MEPQGDECMLERWTGRRVHKKRTSVCMAVVASYRAAQAEVWCWRVLLESTTLTCQFIHEYRREVS